MLSPLEEITRGYNRRSTLILDRYGILEPKEWKEDRRVLFLELSDALESGLADCETMGK